jgi:hypothetical protein
MSWCRLTIAGSGAALMLGVRWPDESKEMARGRVAMSEQIVHIGGVSLRQQLAALRAEHQDLDEAIGRLARMPLGDELLLRRMKKRKLALKDRIAALETSFDPDERA